MKKILIIENDTDTNDALSLFLRELNYEVVQWYDYDALHEIVELKPDLILIDQMLDRILGTNICLVIKNNPLTKMVPVMLMSAITDLERIARESCADDFMVKPFDLAELEQKVKRINI